MTSLRTAGVGIDHQDALATQLGMLLLRNTRRHSFDRCHSLADLLNDAF